MHAKAEARRGGGLCSLFVLLLVAVGCGSFVYVAMEKRSELAELKVVSPAAPLSPKAQRILSKIHPELYLDIASLLLLLSVLLVLRFLWYEFSMLRIAGRRSFWRQILVAIAASSLFGFGYIVLLAWAMDAENTR
mmetsp:Transcript_53525/g.98998  ORF Transcript_53525/g.98998 Transcript_53525/m.98998 type:complete len:135 (+) Transcript_53525:124-528(+)